MNLFEKQSYEFISRHIGPDEHSTKQMLKTIGVPDLDDADQQNCSSCHPDAARN